MRNDINNDDNDDDDKKNINYFFNIKKGPTIEVKINLIPNDKL